MLVESRAAQFNCMVAWDKLVCPIPIIYVYQEHNLLDKLLVLNSIGLPTTLCFGKHINNGMITLTLISNQLGAQKRLSQIGTYTCNSSTSSQNQFNY